MEQKINFWAGFVPVGSTEKKNWANYEQLLIAGFSCFGSKWAVGTQSIVGCSTRDTSPRDLCIMTLISVLFISIPGLYKMKSMCMISFGGLG